MAKVSKMVADRMAIGSTVMSSIAVHGQEIAPRLEAILFPKGVPANLTVAMVLQALHELLGRTGEHLGVSDLAHAAEAGDDEVPRAAREAALAVLRATLVSVRGTFANNFGPALLAAYGIPQAVPEANDVLVRTAELVESGLRERPLTEAPLTAGITVDPIAMAKDLRAKIDAVSAALADVERERRELQLTLQTKTQALSEWNAYYVGAADMITGAYELVGRADLAEVVRPTARRRSGLTETTDVPPPGGEGGAGPTG